MDTEIIVDVRINAYGHRQAVDEQGHSVCIQCHAPYENEGDGVICDKCAEANDQEE
jgi:hypothetical protein